MNFVRRPLFPALLSLATLIAGWVVWLTSSPERESRANATKSTATANSDSLEALATFGALAEADRAAFAQQLLTLLQRRLERRGVRSQEALLAFKDAAAYQRFLARAEAAGLRVIGRLDAFKTVRVGYETLEALRDDMLKHAADYTEVGGNALVQFPQPPPTEARTAGNYVPIRNQLLALLGANGDTSLWGRGVTMAVLDSGVSPDATFGAGRLRYLDVGLGTALGSGEGDGHGTAVAALAAGASADARGIAPSASILSVRVTDANGMSDIFTLSQAIVAAVDAGAKIVNISMGSYATNQALNQAIEYAAEQGVVLVAAAGNDQAAQLMWPAADSRVVSVGAVDAAEQQVIFSNSGPQLQVSAPGYGVQTAGLNGERVLMSGTSASAPVVTGAIAAVMSQNPSLNATQAWQIVQQTANDAGPAGPDPDYGNGVLNLGWAMNRTDPSRIDTAVSSHYYNSSTGEMEFVIQNRSGQIVTGLELSIDAGASNSREKLPALAPGDISVIKTSVSPTQLASAGSMTFRTTLINPPGLVDQVPGNNRKASTLSAPTR